MDREPVVIVGYARTPMASFQGVFAASSAAELGAAAIAAAVKRAGLDPQSVQEVIMGNVLGAGQGQAPARQASLGAGLPLSAGCTTVNKMCGSGMKATMLAHDLIRAGSNQVMVSGGMESMTNAPYLLPRARGGMRMGHGTALDHMFLDGLEDAYDKGRLMGSFAETCADHFGFSREQQDKFAVNSLNRAQEAVNKGKFSNEVVKVTVSDRKGERVIDRDESPFSVDPAKIPSLRPAFRKDGTVTAANSSSISDGAAALVLMSESEAGRQGLRPLARVIGHTTHAQQPEWFTTAPVGAMRKCLEQHGRSVDDIDLFEINEAFAVVTMAAIQELSLPSEKVNIHGGACALGHPIGASGARILVTLLSALEQYDLKTGLASLCIGGGEATAMIIERIK